MLPTDQNRSVARLTVDPERVASLRTPLFPPTVKVTGMLYYEKGLGLTAPISGNVASYVYSANGLFDPNITGTGHQPMGFDQMMLFYNQYTVYRSSIRVSWLANGITARCAIMLSPDTSISTTAGVWMENGLIRSFAMNCSGSNEALLNKLPQVRNQCDVKKYFGITSDQNLLAKDSVSGTVAANPVEQVYFALGVWQLNPDGSTTTSVGFDVQISYDAIFYEPRKSAESLTEAQQAINQRLEMQRVARSAKVARLRSSSAVGEDFKEEHFAYSTTMSDTNAVCKRLDDLSFEAVSVESLVEVHPPPPTPPMSPARAQPLKLWTAPVCGPFREQ